MRHIVAMVAFAVLAPSAAWAQTAGIKINEFLPNPDGTDGTKEWVELHNSSGASIDISGFKLQSRSTATGSISPIFTFPASTSIAAGGYLVLGGDATGVPGADLYKGSALSLPNASTTSADLLRIVTAADAIVDVVVYGGANTTDQLVDETGSVATSLAPYAGADLALARSPNGADTDLSGADFVLAATHTMGAANPDPPQGGSAQGIVINEFLPDPALPTPAPPPPGGDAGFEWIELYNAGTESVDLTGFRLQRKDSGTNWSVVYTIAATGFPAGGSPTEVAVPLAIRTLDPGEYLVIADDEAWVPGAQLYKGAAGSRTSLQIPQGSTGTGLRLVDAATTPGVVDVVVYAPPNTDGIEDELENPATSIAPKPSSGLVLARSPNGLDSNLSGNDFILTATHTMGAANPQPPLCDAGAAGLVINELLPDPPGGADAGKEYVELYNGAGRNVRLEAWRLEWGTSTFSSSFVFDDTVEIAAGDLLVVGGAEVLQRDVTHELTMGNASNSDGVRLKDCAGTVVDTVIYGGPNDGATPWGDDAESPATSLAPFTSGQAIARRLDGVDTNRSGDDFQVTATLTPGAPNPAPGMCVTDQGRIVINEFLPNPAGSDSGNEWLELFNKGSTAVRLDGWTIRVATSSDSYSVKATLPTGLEIPAGGRVLVGENNVFDADANVTLAMGGGTGADGVRLVDCAGNVADTVVYGDGSNGDGVVDDSGLPAISVASKPAEAHALARKRDGADTDQSGEDFATTANPTPGAANPELICIQNTGNVKLNEILPDPDGADSEAATEFIELYNAGSQAVDLDGWQIVLSGSGDDKTVDLVLPPATRIPATTWLVIGNANVADADVYAEFSIGNGTGGDAVYLLDCTGAMVDSVAYGPDNTDLVTDESNAVATVAGNPGEARTLARVDDGIDSNAIADWFVDSTPTPGATNFQEPVDVPDDDQRGCKRDGPPGSGAPDGGCSTVPAAMGGMALLPLLFAIRRRRA